MNFKVVHLPLTIMFLFDVIGQDIMKAVVSIASDNYPEMMARSFMVNAPWIFNTLWYVLKGLLAERTVDKV